MAGWGGRANRMLVPRKLCKQPQEIPFILQTLASKIWLCSSVARALQSSSWTALGEGGAGLGKQVGSHPSALGSAWSRCSQAVPPLQ